MSEPRKAAPAGDCSACLRLLLDGQITCVDTATLQRLVATGNLLAHYLQELNAGAPPSAWAAALPPIWERLTERLAGREEASCR